MYKVLFICSGATCRSPMASSLFNHKIKSANISGATSHFCGMFVEYGSHIRPESKAALKDYGINRVCGEPVQITGKHLAEHNLIVCLTEDHKQALTNMVAEKFISKIVCFKDFCGMDIADPYGGDIGTYRRTLNQISIGLDALINSLLNSAVIKYKRSKNV